MLFTSLWSTIFSSMWVSEKNSCKVTGFITLVDELLSEWFPMLPCKRFNSMPPMYLSLRNTSKCKKQSCCSYNKCNSKSRTLQNRWCNSLGLFNFTKVETNTNFLPLQSILIFITSYKYTAYTIYWCTKRWGIKYAKQWISFTHANCRTI